MVAGARVVKRYLRGRGLGCCPPLVAQGNLHYTFQNPREMCIAAVANLLHPNQSPCAICSHFTLDICRNNRARARAWPMACARRESIVWSRWLWPLYNVFHKVRLLYKYFERRFPEREAAPENISRTGSSPGNIKCARCRHLGPEADLRTPGVLVVARLLLPDARGYALAARCPLSSASVGP